MIQILVTGASGQIGQELQYVAPQFPQFQFHFASKNALDIADKAQVDSVFRMKKINYCINCAAYTAVDKAEQEAAQAYQINVQGVSHLAEACYKNDAIFIHFSSDYVYHNAVNTPLRETDPTTPKSVYAQTKLQGEEAATGTEAQVIVIRTSWVYSSFGHNFVKTMLRLGQERPELRVVYDQIGTPTYARDLTQAVLDMIAKAHVGTVDRALLSGIYHYSNEGVCSWYDFALAIFEMRGIACHVQPIETKDYPTPAARPPYSVLNKRKIRETFELQIPHWREGLRRCLQQLHNG